MKLSFWSICLFGCYCVVTVDDNMREYVVKVKAGKLGGTDRSRYTPSLARKIVNGCEAVLGLSEPSN